MAEHLSASLETAARSPTPKELGWSCTKATGTGESHWVHRDGTAMDFELTDVRGTMRTRVNGGPWVEVHSFGDALRLAHAKTGSILDLLGIDPPA